MDHIQRCAIVIKETGEISSISEMTQSREPWLDKGQAATHEIVRGIPDTARIGMVRKPDGSFDWPVGHQNESGSARKARQASKDAA